MSDYIDRQAALNAINIEREYMTRRQEWGAEHILTHYGYRIIADMPSADVEPVMRCRDCKYNNGGYCHNDGGFAHFDHFVVQDDDYCSRGERMDGEEDDSKGND